MTKTVKIHDKDYNLVTEDAKYGESFADALSRFLVRAQKDVNLNGAIEDTARRIAKSKGKKTSPKSPVDKEDYMEALQFYLKKMDQEQEKK